MNAKFYTLSSRKVWKGRVDDTQDYDSFRWHQIINFIDVNSDIKKVDSKEIAFCFLGFCCDIGITKNKGRYGAINGPDSIRTEMSNMPCNFPQNVKLYDAGNLNCENMELEDAQNLLAETVNKILKLNMTPLIMGGGHEIALGHYNGIIKHFGKEEANKIGIINLDAHLDIRPYENGASSGTMFRQISDNCHNKNIKFNYLCIGAQTYGNTRSLFKKLEEIKGKYILAKDIKEYNLINVFNKIDKFVYKQDQIYLTLCADVISSAYAPGVSAPQPFGLHPEIIVEIIKHLIVSRKIISFDIAEVSPRFDEDHRTSKLAAIIYYSFIINTIQLD